MTEHNLSFLRHGGVSQIDDSSLLLCYISLSSSRRHFGWS